MVASETCGRGEISVVLISDLNNTHMHSARKTQKNEKSQSTDFTCEGEEKKDEWKQCFRAVGAEV